MTVGAGRGRRPRLELRVITAAGAAAVLLLGTGAVAGRAGRRERVVRLTPVAAGPATSALSSTPTPSPTHTPGPTPTGPPDNATLASLVLPSPAGLLRTLDVSLPLATLAKQFSQPAEVTRDLTSDGYAEGIQVAYGARTRAVDVELWRFASDAGAADFANSYRLSNQPGAVISAVAPAAGTPGGYLYTFAKPDDNGYGSVVGVAVRGRIIIRIRYAVADGVRTSTALVQELRDQYGRLPVGGSEA